MSVCGRTAGRGAYRRDNGEAAAEGQRSRKAFPKGIEAVLCSLLLDLWAFMNPGRESALQQ
jgi:hypothetical protein